MGLKKPMTAESIRFASQVILEDYSYLTPDDIVLWLTNVAKGSTDIYGSALDGPTLLKTLKKYVNNRIDTAAARSLDAMRIYSTANKTYNAQVQKDDTSGIIYNSNNYTK